MKYLSEYQLRLFFKAVDSQRRGKPNGKLPRRIAVLKRGFLLSRAETIDFVYTFP
jgi:hypothetical protein